MKGSEKSIQKKAWITDLLLPIVLGKITNPKVIDK
jgi:hypothetical protein